MNLNEWTCNLTNGKEKQCLSYYHTIIGSAQSKDIQNHPKQNVSNVSKPNLMKKATSSWVPCCRTGLAHLISRSYVFVHRLCTSCSKSTAVEPSRTMASPRISHVRGPSRIYVNLNLNLTIGNWHWHSWKLCPASVSVCTLSSYTSRPNTQDLNMQKSAIATVTVCFSCVSWLSLGVSVAARDVFESMNAEKNISAQCQVPSVKGQDPLQFHCLYYCYYILPLQNTTNHPNLVPCDISQVPTSWHTPPS